MYIITIKHTTHIIQEKCPYTELMNAIEEIKSFIKLYKLTKMDIVVDGAAQRAIVEQTRLIDTCCACDFGNVFL
jgi:hypothetical protein